MACKPEFNYKETYYGQVCRSIEKQIFNKDPKFKNPTFYGVSIDGFYFVFQGFLNYFPISLSSKRMYK